MTFFVPKDRIYLMEMRLFRYNIHDGDQFHVDLKPEPPKAQQSNRTGKTLAKYFQKFYFLSS